MYVNFPNLVLNTWTDLSPLQRGSISLDKDRQELSNKNPKAYSHFFLLYSFLYMKAIQEFVHRMLYDCTIGLV